MASDLCAQEIDLLTLVILKQGAKISTSEVSSLKKRRNKSFEFASSDCESSVFKIRVSCF